MQKNWTYTSWAIPVAVLIVALLAVPALGEEIQTPSSVIPETLELISACAALDEEQKATLATQFEEAAVGEYLTDAQAVVLLNASGLPALAEGDDPALLLDGLTMILDALIAGLVDPDSAILSISVWADSGGDLDALAGLLDEQASPPGILNAIGGALADGGYLQTDSDTVFAQVELLIEAGVPPGIVVRVSKDTIRDGDAPDTELLLEQLRVLGELIADGESPGHAANEVTGNGKDRNRHQEEEQESNTNASDGVPPGQQKEKESNANANANKKP